MRLHTFANLCNEVLGAVVAWDDDLTALLRLAGIAFTGVGACANAEVLDIRLDQIDEFFRPGNAGAQGRVGIELTASITRTQSIGVAVDPAGDLDEAGTLGKVRAFYEARREDEIGRASCRERV